MKIVRLFPYFNKSITGGLNPNIYYLSKYQALEGHKVDIITFSNDKPHSEKLENFNIHYIKKPIKSRIFGGISFINEIIRLNLKPDIIHGLNAIPFGWLFPLAKKKYPKAKYAISIHTSISNKNKNYIEGLSNKIDSYSTSTIIKNASKNADLVLPVADFIKEELINSNISQNKIKVIPTGVNYQLFNKYAQNQNKKLNNSSFKVIKIGRLSQMKGTKYLLEAIKKLKKENIKFTFLGCDKSDNNYTETISFIKKHGLQNIISIIPPIPYNKIPNILAKQDLLVHPSISEPRAKVIQEAQATGIPIVATKSGGITQNIKHKETGYLIPTKNSGALSKAILELKQNLKLRKTIADNGIIEAKKYNWIIISKKFTSAFQDTLK